MFAGLRRYSLVALVAMVVSVPFLYWLMPTLMRIVFTDKYEPATDAARLMLLAGAVGLVFAWTKSLPVSMGRPELRIVTHGIETLVLIPLVLVFGSMWDATGRRRRRPRSRRCVFAVAWLVALVRLHSASTPRSGGDAVKVLVVSGIWPPDVGGPASHAPEVAEYLRRPRPRGRGGDDRRRRRPPRAGYPVHWISRGAAGPARATCAARCSSAGRPAASGRRLLDRHVRPHARRLAARRDSRAWSS